MVALILAIVLPLSSATKVSHQYFMTISPADGHLYVSDSEKYQVGGVPWLMKDITSG